MTTTHPWTLWRRATKRVLDVVVATAGLVVGSVIMLPAILVIRVAMGSPVVFSQNRIGRDGRPFRVYKLRTMVHSDVLATTVTRADDERITPVGRVLRRTKLDEIPQLWNVIRGDMSLVGPRPDVPGFADELTGADRVILLVRPGITGPASVAFRDEEELLAGQPDPEEYNATQLYPAKVRLNRVYVERSRLRDDLRYLWWTVKHPPQTTIEHLRAIASTEAH